MKDYVDHVDYVVNLIGIDHVSFSADNTLDGNKDDKGNRRPGCALSGLSGKGRITAVWAPSRMNAMPRGFEGCWQLEM